MRNLSYFRFHGRKEGQGASSYLLFSAPVVAKLLLFVAFLLAGNGLFAQHHFILYNMPQVPQAYTLNPGNVPLVKGYVGLPVVTGVRTGVSSKGFKLDQIGLENGFQLSNIDFGSILGRLESDNRFAMESDVQLMNFGFRFGNGFAGGNITEHVNYEMFYPESMVRLFDDVQGADTTELNGMYDLSRFDLQAMHYRSYALGYAHTIGKRFTIGARVKYLQGFSNLWTINDNFALEAPTQGQDNFEINGRLHVLAAGLGELTRIRPSGDFRSTANVGFAADFGFVYRVNFHWEFSASALNLGVIRWKEKVTYRPVSLGRTELSSEDLQHFEAELRGVVDSLVNGDVIDGQGLYQTPLVQNYYFSTSYYLNSKTYISAMVNPRVSMGMMDMGFGLAANTRLGKAVSVSAAYSAYNDNFFNFGAGASVDLGPLQLYAVTDNLLAPFSFRAAHHSNTQFGLNFTFGKIAREELLPYDPVADKLRKQREQELAAAKRLKRNEKQKEEIADARRKRDKKREKQKEEIAEQKAKKDKKRRDEKPEEEVAELRQKPEKTRKQKPLPTEEIAEPAKPAEEKPEKAAEPSKRFTINILSFDKVSGQPMKGISLEIFKVTDKGPRLIFIGSAYSGRFSMPLERRLSHIIIVHKQGYASQEISVPASDVLPEEQEIRRDFHLSLQSKAGTTTVEQQEQERGIGTLERSELSSSDSTPQLLYFVRESARMREGPDDSYRAVRRLSSGELIEVLDRSGMIWWRVRFKEKTGYIQAQMLEPLNR